MNYNQNQTALAGHLTPNNNVLDRLRGKQSHLEIELNKTKEAIAALENNPDLLKVLDALQGTIY